MLLGVCPKVGAKALEPCIHPASRGKEMVRGAGFEPATPTVSSHKTLLENHFYSVSRSMWSHANPCEKAKCNNKV